jgi:hypothetical protein
VTLDSTLSLYAVENPAAPIGAANDPKLIPRLSPTSHEWPELLALARDLL